MTSTPDGLSGLPNTYHVMYPVGRSIRPGSAKIPKGKVNKTASGATTRAILVRKTIFNKSIQKELNQMLS